MTTQISNNTYKLKKPNILDYLDIRQPNVPPQHFEYIFIPIQYNLEKTISRWITQNLKGRFYVGKSPLINKDKDVTEQLKIGFEDPKELSYFTLACPHLKYK